MKGLEGKNILFVNSGSKQKKFTLEKAKEFGAKIILLKEKMSWEKGYVDKFIPADRFAHNLAISSLRDALNGEKLDGAVTFWEDDVQLLAAICREFKLKGPSMKAAELARNKYAMRKAMKKARVPCPKFALLRKKADLNKAIEEIGFPAVIKPCWGADNEFVVRVDDKESAYETYDYVMKNATPKFNLIYRYNNSEFIYEEYIDGQELNAEVITQGWNVQVVALSDKMRMQLPYFMERGDYAPSRLSSNIQKKVEKEVVKATNAVGLRNCVAHVEIRLTKEGPKVIEINARMGGDYTHDWVNTVWGIDLVEAALKIAVGTSYKFKKPNEPRCYLAGNYFTPEVSGIITGIRGFDNLEKIPSVHDAKLFKKIGQAALVPPQGFEKLGWVVAKGSSPTDAREKLEESLSRITITVKKYSGESSLGLTRRRSPLSSASLDRSRLLGSARIERIRMVENGEIGKLKVGVLCNLYENAKEENLVKQDLMSVGKNIEQALNQLGHEVVFFDMNADPLPFNKIRKSKVDIIFNVCERINDSSLMEPYAAALLDMLQIPYTGANPQTLATCIDKIRVKKLLDYHDIPTPNWDYIYNIDEEIDEELRYPLIVKPANADNSIGITNDSVVTNEEQLQKQLHKVVVEISSPALIEEYIDGNEFDITLLGSEGDLKVLPISRSVFDKLPAGYWHIYPFDAKWKDDDPVYGKIDVELPAKIPKPIATLMTELAIDTYNILDCHDYGRVEIRVDKENNPYVIELNPNPSINRGDIVPEAAELIGMSYEQFIDYILRSAIRRYKDRPPYYHLRTSTMY